LGKSCFARSHRTPLLFCLSGKCQSSTSLLPQERHCKRFPVRLRSRTSSQRIMEYGSICREASTVTCNGSSIPHVTAQNLPAHCKSLLFWSTASLRRSTYVWSSQLLITLCMQQASDVGRIQCLLSPWRHGNVLSQDKPELLVSQSHDRTVRFSTIYVAHSQYISGWNIVFPSSPTHH
jgi:hypothetical protein